MSFSSLKTDAAEIFVLHAVQGLVSLLRQWIIVCINPFLFCFDCVVLNKFQRQSRDVALVKQFSSTALHRWQIKDKRSFELVTLMGLWLVPAVVSVHLSCWRFLLVCLKTYQL